MRREHAVLFGRVYITASSDDFGKRYFCFVKHVYTTSKHITFFASAKLRKKLLAVPEWGRMIEVIRTVPPRREDFLSLGKIFKFCREQFAVAHFCFQLLIQFLSRNPLMACCSLFHVLSTLIFHRSILFVSEWIIFPDITCYYWMFFVFKCALCNIFICFSIEM